MSKVKFPTECPVCGECGDIDTYDISGGDDEMFTYWSCGQCESQWTIKYVIASVTVTNAEVEE